MNAASLRREVRLHLQKKYGWYSVEVASEFEAKNVRRLARAIGKNLGIRVHSGLAQKRQDAAPWPRVLHLWNPDVVVSEADMREAALAMDAFLRSGGSTHKP